MTDSALIIHHQQPDVLTFLFTAGGFRLPSSRPVANVHFSVGNNLQYPRTIEKASIATWSLSRINHLPTSQHGHPTQPITSRGPSQPLSRIRQTQILPLQQQIHAPPPSQRHHPKTPHSPPSHRLPFRRRRSPQSRVRLIQDSIHVSCETRAAITA